MTTPRPGSLTLKDCPWPIGRLGREGRFIAGTGFPHAYQGRDGQPVKFFKVGDMNAPGNERFLSVTENTVTEADVRALRARLCPAGGVAFAKVGAALQLNRRRIVETPCLFDNNMMAFLARSAEPRFVWYWLQLVDFGQLSNPGPVPSVNEGALRQVAIPLAPLQAQRRIADFLDRKTGVIDELIAKKERLIELLEEKRQALITRAVTKGLEPNVPMKDSGIEWLGQIPAYWEVKRLKHVADRLSVGIVVTPAKYYDDSGSVPTLRSLNVRAREIVESELVRISEASNLLHSKSMLRAGDIVAVRTGQPGTAAVIPKHLDRCNCIDLIIVRQAGRFSSEFVCEFMNSEFAHSQYSQGSGGAIQQHFNVGAAKDLVLPLPPHSEQVLIAERLAEMHRRSDECRALLQSQLSKLREYRSALITAAVTGQLEVA